VVACVRAVWAEIVDGEELVRMLLCCSKFSNFVMNDGKLSLL